MPREQQCRPSPAGQHAACARCGPAARLRAAVCLPQLWSHASSAGAAWHVVGGGGAAHHGECPRRMSGSYRVVQPSAPHAKTSPGRRIVGPPDRVCRTRCGYWLSAGCQPANAAVMRQWSGASPST
eukprot:7637453-Pyramimonas_sp.AAC.1